MENYVLAIDSNDASCELLTPRKAVKRKRERESGTKEDLVRGERRARG